MDGVCGRDLWLRLMKELMIQAIVGGFPVHNRMIHDAFVTTASFRSGSLPVRRNQTLLHIHIHSQIGGVHTPTQRPHRHFRSG